MLEVFGITRPLSKKGCPYDNAVDESANKTLKAEFVWRERFEDLHDLQVRLADYVWRYNHERLHSTLGYMSPAEFRKQGLSLRRKCPEKGCQSTGGVPPTSVNELIRNSLPAETPLDTAPYDEAHRVYDVIKRSPCKCLGWKCPFRALYGIPLRFI